MRTILSRALAELNAHRSVVLVTIVAEQGSAPRGPGSQMLVGADGQLTGTIGGGQVERQSELLALSLLKERRSQIQHFALTQAGADSLGMACGGDVTVLFQFISPEDILWQSVLETALDRQRLKLQRCSERIIGMLIMCLIVIGAHRIVKAFSPGTRLRLEKTHLQGHWLMSFSMSWIMEGKLVLACQQLSPKIWPPWLSRAGVTSRPIFRTCTLMHSAQDERASLC